MRFKEFNVIYREKETEEFTVYICRKTSENRLYRVFELTDRVKIIEYIKYFDSLKFKGFYGDFSINKKYYIVFEQPDGIIMESSGIEKLSARDVVKTLAMQNPPLEIALPMLSFDNIFLCGDEIRFAYVLPKLDKSVSKHMLEEKLADMVDMLWSEYRSEEARQWLVSLRSGQFTHLVDAFKFMPESETAPVESRLEYLDKIKNIFVKAAAIITVIISILAVYKLMAEDNENNLEYDKIDSIGDIKLIDN